MTPEKEAMMFEFIGRQSFENAVLKGEVTRLMNEVASLIPKKPDMTNKGK